MPLSTQALQGMPPIPVHCHAPQAAPEEDLAGSDEDLADDLAGEDQRLRALSQALAIFPNKVNAALCPYSIS